MLDSYGIAAKLSGDDLNDTITRFFTDATFSHPLDCARNSLLSQQPAEKTRFTPEKTPWPTVYQHTTVQSYRIKFGNPFPGQCYEVAQHCVEVIYLFDAFHDHMILVDPPNILSAEATGTRSPASASDDSGYLSERTGTNAEETKPVDRDRVPASNADLRGKLQQKWISFIVDDQSEVLEMQKEHNDKAWIAVYGKDRRIAVESLTSRLDWIKQKQRFELLAEDWKSASAALKRITGGV